jgi:glycosyltransferase involved in cell wall biosynthesis
LPFRRKGKFSRLINELLGTAPGFLYKYIPPNLLKAWADGRQYDWVWVSPATHYSIAKQARDLGLPCFEHIAVGLNDVKTSLYADSFNEMIGYGKLKPKLIFQWIRSFWMSRAERSYLSKVDMIHVQTKRENEKARKVLGRFKDKVEIVSAPNGIKLDLIDCSYLGADSNKILYMTHLNRGRRTESEWFLTKIWPLIQVELPDAELLIVGRPPEPDDDVPFLKDVKNVRVYGFADDLAEVMDDVRMAIVPIFHGTGLINRIQDALIASLPVVSTSSAISTLDDLQPDKDVLSADTIQGFSKEVIRLYQDKDLRLELSRRGRAYAKNRPNWDDTATKIEKSLERLRSTSNKNATK